MESRKDEKQIVMYHVGGEGDYGPGMAVLRRMKGHSRLVVFEARPETEDQAMSDTLIKDGIPTTLIHKGVDERAGVAELHVNKWPLSSSFLPVSPLSVNENPAYDHCHTWGENAALDHKISVECMSLDEVVERGLAPPPDVISIDAQGAEVRILRGARKCLETALCVVSEVEFFEIYQGQGLFDDQMTMLGDMGYRLFTIFNPQYWHPGPAAGKGFLTVGEATFFRYACAELGPTKRGHVSFDSLTDGQLIRMAGISMAFECLSYTYKLGTVLRDRSPKVFEDLNNDDWYRVVPALVNSIESHKQEYQANPLVFLNAFQIGAG